MAVDLRRRLLSAIDDMQGMAPGSVTHVKKAPDSDRARTPWFLAARFVLPAGTFYDDVFQYFRDWRDDRGIEKKIGAQRLSRIQIRYKNRKGRGAAGEYTVAEIGPWEIVISRAVERTGIRDDRLDSLITRYGQKGEVGKSYIESIIVWFSSATSREIKFGKKATKNRRRV